jgi:hypothetical protein
MAAAWIAFWIFNFQTATITLIVVSMMIVGVSLFAPARDFLAVWRPALRRSRACGERGWKSRDEMARRGVVVRRRWVLS